MTNLSPEDKERIRRAFGITWGSIHLAQRGEHEYVYHHFWLRRHRSRSLGNLKDVMETVRRHEESQSPSSSFPGLFFVGLFLLVLAIGIGILALLDRSFPQRVLNLFRETS